MINTYRIKQQDIKLCCGFCGHSDNYIKKTSVGKGHHANGSSAIQCNKCNRNLNQKNKVE